MFSRAKTLDGEWVDGYYFSNENSTDYITNTEYDEIRNYQIDPTTLKYKIGDEWYSMEELECAMRRHEEYKETWRVFGKTFTNLKENK